MLAVLLFLYCILHFFGYILVYVLSFIIVASFVIVSYAIRTLDICVILFILVQKSWGQEMVFLSQAGKTFRFIALAINSLQSDEWGSNVPHDFK